MMLFDVLNRVKEALGSQSTELENKPILAVRNSLSLISTHDPAAGPLNFKWICRHKCTQIVQGIFIATLQSPLDHITGTYQNHPLDVPYLNMVEIEASTRSDRQKVGPDAHCTWGTKELTRVASRLAVTAKRLDTPTSRSKLINERGQGLVEYALSLVLVGMVAMVALIAVSPALQEVFCDAIYMLNPAVIGECASLFDAPKINKAKYNTGPMQIEIVAKAPYGCTGDLIVMPFGATMERAGSSVVFSTEISTGSPPASVTIGSSSCGWTTVPLS
ncbi:MAG: Flp family type IVb pilin [Anaerolineales bacterium]